MNTVLGKPFSSLAQRSIITKSKMQTTITPFQNNCRLSTKINVPHIYWTKADDKIFVCKFSTNGKSKLYHIENSKTVANRANSVDLDLDEVVIIITLFANSAICVSGTCS